MSETAAVAPKTILEVGGPLPQAMGRCADLYHDVRALRLAMEKEVKAIQERENEIEEHIINNLSKSDDTGAAGLRYRAQVVKKRIPRIHSNTEDMPGGGWGILCSWIRKNDRFDMLQKRISEKAIIEWQEENARTLPGIEMVNVVDLSVTKIK